MEIAFAIRDPTLSGDPAHRFGTGQERNYWRTETWSKFICSSIQTIERYLGTKQDLIQPSMIGSRSATETRCENRSLVTTGLGDQGSHLEKCVSINGVL